MYVATHDSKRFQAIRIIATISAGGPRETAHDRRLDYGAGAGRPFLAARREM